MKVLSIILLLLFLTPASSPGIVDCVDMDLPEHEIKSYVEEDEIPGTNATISVKDILEKIDATGIYSFIYKGDTAYHGSLTDWEFILYPKHPNPSTYYQGFLFERLLDQAKHDDCGVYVEIPHPLPPIVVDPFAFPENTQLLSSMYESENVCSVTNTPPVPEPSSIVLMCIGCFLISHRSR